MGVSFFFLTQIWHLTKKRKKKQNEEKKYETNGPGQANKKNSAGGINRGKKKELFASFPSCFFFPCDQWQQVFLFETSSICLPEWLCWKKKKQFTDQMQAKSSENSTKKETTLLPSIEKKTPEHFFFKTRSLNFRFWDC